MKKAIVTGSSGFIGNFLCKELLRQGYKVIGVQRRVQKESQINSADFSIIYKDIEDLEASDFTNFENSVFFHFAWEGVSGTGDANEGKQLNNIAISEKAISLAVKIHCKKFIFAGSVLEYLHEANSSIDAVKKYSGYDYGNIKLLGHKRCLSLSQILGIEFNSCLISNVYGYESTPKRFISTLVMKMLLNENVTLSSCQQKIDFVNIEDAINQIIIIAEKGNNGKEYYVGSGTIKSLREYVEVVKEIINKDYIFNFDESNIIKSIDYEDFNYKEDFEELKYLVKIPFVFGIGNLKEKYKEKLNGKQ